MRRQPAWKGAAILFGAIAAVLAAAAILASGMEPAAKLASLAIEAGSVGVGVALLVQEP